MSKEIAQALMIKGQDLRAGLVPQLAESSAAVDAAQVAQDAAALALKAAQEDAADKDQALGAAKGALDAISGRDGALAGAIDEADDAGDLYDAAEYLEKGKQPELAVSVRAQADAKLASARAVIAPPVESAPAGVPEEEQPMP